MNNLNRQNINFDNDRQSEYDPQLMAAIAAQQEMLRRENNPYKEGLELSIPDEHIEDFLDEYDRSDRENDPLLKYILMKHAQEGFKHGPIGTDGYYEMYDPKLNPNLQSDYEDFLSTFYNK